MNSLYSIDEFIGAEGRYPILDYVDDLVSTTSNNLIYNDTYNSNQLILYVNRSSNQLIEYVNTTSNVLTNYINLASSGLSNDIKYNYKQIIEGNNKNAMIYGDDKIYLKTANNAYETRINTNGSLEVLVQYEPETDDIRYALITQKYGQGKWMPIRDIFLDDLLEEVQADIDNLTKIFFDLKGGLDTTAALQVIGGALAVIGGSVGTTLITKALTDGLNFGQNGANSSNNQQLLLNYLLLSMIDCINNNSNNIRLTSNYAINTSNVISNRITNTSNELAGLINTNTSTLYTYIDDRWDKTGTTLYYNDGGVGIGTSIISANKIFEVTGNVLFNNELQVTQKVGIGTSVIQLNKVLDVKGNALFEDEVHINKKISTSEVVEAVGYIKTSSNLYARKAAINKAVIKDGYDLDLEGNLYVLGSNVMELPDSLLELPVLNNTLAQTNINLKVEINKANQGVLKEIVNNEEWFYDPFNILYDSTYKIVVGNVGGIYNTGGLTYYGKGGFGGEMMDNIPISISLWCYKTTNFGDPSVGTIFYTKILEGKHLDFLNDSMKFMIFFRRFINFGVYTNEVVIQYRAQSGGTSWVDVCVYTLDNGANSAFRQPAFYTFNMTASSCQIYVNGVLKASTTFSYTLGWTFKLTRLTIPSDKIAAGTEADQSYRWNFLYFHKNKNLSVTEALYLYRFAADKLTYTLRVNGSLRTNALYVDVIYQDFKPILWTDFTQNVINTSNSLQAQIDQKEPIINLGTTQYALINSANGKVAVNSLITKQELDTLNDINTNFTIQQQLDGKQPNITAGSGLTFSGNTLNTPWTIVGGNVRLTSTSASLALGTLNINSGYRLDVIGDFRADNIFFNNNGINENRVVYTDALKSLKTSDVTITELNYLSNTTKNINSHFIDTSNYVLNTSNQIINRITTLDSNVSNYVSNTSNQIINRITTLDSNVSNYVSNTSNQITNRITTLDSNVSNYVSNTSNQITNRITTLDSNVSNYVSNTSNQITNRITTLDSNVSNYVSNTSNQITNRITTLDSNVSNYVSNTSNQITNRITTLDSNVSNYVLYTSNAISNRINNLNLNSVWTTNGTHIYNNNTGDVGIGLSTPQDELHLHKSTNPAVDTRIRFTNFATGLTSGDGSCVGVDPSGNLEVRNIENLPIILYTNNAERARITNTGDVGIGLSTPQDELHIHRSTNPSVDCRVRFTNFTTGSASTDGSCVGVDASGNLEVRNIENLPTIFYNNNAEVVRILNDGTVGIGTNVAPSRLTILSQVVDRSTYNHGLAPCTVTNQTATSTTTLNDPQPILNLCRQGTAGQAFGARATLSLCRYENSTTNSRSRLDFDLAHGSYDNVKVLSLQSFGNVGIGITNPISKLHLHETGTNTAVQIRLTDGTTFANTGDGCVIEKETTQNLRIWNFEANDLRLGTNNTEYFRIKANGAVGIGTNDPTSRLHFHIFSGGAGAQVRLLMTDDLTTGATNRGFAIYKDDNHNGFLRNYETSKEIIFQVNSGNANTSNAIRINNTGNVGIHTSVAGVPLHIQGKLCVDTVATGAPSVGTYGGDNGTRIVLWKGSAAETPYALGINGSTLWYGTPAGATHRFYQGTTEVCAINNNGIYATTGWFRNYGYTGLYNENGGQHFYRNDAQFGNWLIRGGEVGGWSGIRFSDAEVSLMCGNSGVKRCGFHYNGIGWGFYVDESRNAYVINNLKIGDTSTPITRLQVNSGSYSTTYTSVRWFNNNGMSGFFSSQVSGGNCALFGSDIAINGQVLVYSDNRIKKNMTDINDDFALEKILQMQPKKYQYIEEVQRTSNFVYGFSAQQVREVIPDAVSIQRGILPNIYDVCTYTSNYTSNVNILSFNSNLNLQDINVGSNLRLYDWDSQSTEHKIVEYSSNSIVIEGDIKNTCNVCFAFGTEVNDLNVLNKDYIFTLNVCATQELHRIIMRQNERINYLENIILGSSSNF